MDTTTSSYSEPALILDSQRLFHNKPTKVILRVTETWAAARGVSEADLVSAGLEMRCLSADLSTITPIAACSRCGPVVRVSSPLRILVQGFLAVQFTLTPTCSSSRNHLRTLLVLAVEIPRAGTIISISFDICARDKRQQTRCSSGQPSPMSSPSSTPVAAPIVAAAGISPMSGPVSSSPFALPMAAHVPHLTLSSRQPPLQQQQQQQQQQPVLFPPPQQQQQQQHQQTMRPVEAILPTPRGGEIAPANAAAAAAVATAARPALSVVAIFCCIESITDFVWFRINAEISEVVTSQCPLSFFNFQRKGDHLVLVYSTHEPDELSLFARVLHDTCNYLFSRNVATIFDFQTSW